jgi:hypothetical protein
MNADPRIAEWLTEEAPYEDEGSDPPPEEALAGRAAPEPARERAGGAHGPPPSRPSPSAPMRRARHVPASLGLAGPEAPRFLEVLQAVGRRIRRRPFTALAVAAGAGFIIGGAMTFRAGRILLAAGARHAARELLKQLL